MKMAELLPLKMYPNSLKSIDKLPCLLLFSERETTFNFLFASVDKKTFPNWCLLLKERI